MWIKKMENQTKGIEELLKFAEAYATLADLESSFNTAGVCNNRPQAHQNAGNLLRYIDKFCKLVPKEIRDKLSRGNDTYLADLKGRAEWSYENLGPGR
jgi:Tfp pilus assembly protein PilX